MTRDLFPVMCWVNLHGVQRSAFRIGSGKTRCGRARRNDGCVSISLFIFSLSLSLSLSLYKELYRKEKQKQKNKKKQVCVIAGCPCIANQPHESWHLMLRVCLLWSYSLVSLIFLPVSVIRLLLFSVVMEWVKKDVLNRKVYPVILEMIKTIKGCPVFIRYSYF